MRIESSGTAPRKRAQPRSGSVEPLSGNCCTCPCGGNPLWRLLDDGDIARIDRVKMRKPYLPGQSIYGQGGECRGLYCIVSGLVATRQIEPDGASVIVRIAGEGDLLGYRTFFAGGRYPDSAEALLPTILCFIPREIIYGILERHPNVALHFLRRLAMDQAAIQQKFLHSSSYSVCDRLIRLIFTFRKRYGSLREDGSLEIRVPIARKDMAAMIGTCAESVVRAMRSMEQGGIARFDGRKVVIPRPDLLCEDPKYDDSDPSPVEDERGWGPQGRPRAQPACHGRLG